MSWHAASTRGWARLVEVRTFCVARVLPSGAKAARGARLVEVLSFLCGQGLAVEVRTFCGSHRFHRKTAICAPGRLWEVLSGILAMFHALTTSQSLWIVRLWQAALTVTMHVVVGNQSAELLAAKSMVAMDKLMTTAAAIDESWPSFAQEVRLPLMRHCTPFGAQGRRRTAED